MSLRIVMAIFGLAELCYVGKFKEIEDSSFKRLENLEQDPIYTTRSFFSQMYFWEAASKCLSFVLFYVSSFAPEFPFKFSLAPIGLHFLATVIIFFLKKNIISYMLLSRNPEQRQKDQDVSVRLAN